jgi:hypothetical protein
MLVKAGKINPKERPNSATTRIFMFDTTPILLSFFNRLEKSNFAPDDCS